MPDETYVFDVWGDWVRRNTDPFDRTRYIRRVKDWLLALYHQLDTMAEVKVTIMGHNEPRPKNRPRYEYWGSARGTIHVTGEITASTAEDAVIIVQSWVDGQLRDMEMCKGPTITWR